MGKIYIDNTAIWLYITDEISNNLDHDFVFSDMSYLQLIKSDVIGYYNFVASCSYFQSYVFSDLAFLYLQFW